MKTNHVFALALFCILFTTVFSVSAQAAGSTCKATGCSWSKSGSVKEGTEVTMNAGFSGTCSGATIKYEIYEDDVIGNDFVTSRSGSYANVNNIKKWTTKWMEDAYNYITKDNDPEYFFKLYVNGAKQCSSDDLKVTKNTPIIICSANSKRCNGGNVEQCNSQGTAWGGFQSCYYGCAGGTCMPPPPICTSFSKRCNGNKLERCDAQGMSWPVIENCQYGCNSGTLTCKPPPPICSAGAKRCSGGNVERCNSQGSAWEGYQTCKYGCDAAALACKPALICNPNEKVCLGNIAEQCNSQGTDWQNVVTCKYGCSSGVCNAPTPIVLGDASTLLGANSACPPIGTVTISADCARALAIRDSGGKIWEKVSSYGETALKVAGYIWVISGLGCAAGYLATTAILACPVSLGAGCAVGAGGIALTSISCGVFAGDTELIGSGAIMASSAFRSTKLADLIGAAESTEIASGASIISKEATENLADIKYAKNGIQRETAIIWETPTKASRYETNAVVELYNGKEFLKMFDEGVDAFGLSKRYTKLQPLVNFPGTIGDGTSLGRFTIRPLPDGRIRSEFSFPLNSYMQEDHATVVLDSTIFHEFTHAKYTILSVENSVTQTASQDMAQEIFANTVPANLKTLDAETRANFVEGRKLKILKDTVNNALDWVKKTPDTDVGITYVSARRLGLTSATETIENAAKTAYGGSEPKVVERMRAYADAWAPDIDVVTRDISAENPTPELLNIFKKDYRSWSFMPPAQPITSADTLIAVPATTLPVCSSTQDSQKVDTTTKKRSMPLHIMETSTTTCTVINPTEPTAPTGPVDW